DASLNSPRGHPPPRRVGPATETAKVEQSIQWVVNPANGSRGPRGHAPQPREPACRLAYGASGTRAEGQIRARCRTTACIGGTIAVRKPAGSSADAIADRVGALLRRVPNAPHSITISDLRH